MDLHIFPPEETLEANITLPLSKSISNRALIINALADNTIPFDHVAKCDDTDVMVSALTNNSSEINIGAAGTAMRFLTAYFAMQDRRNVTLNGSERMRHRPIKALVDALRECGAHIEYLHDEGYPPLRISGTKLSGGDICLPASISSQYISAILMIAPYMEKGLHLTLDGDIISRPYITMTLSMMRQWGIHSDFHNNEITIAPQQYSPIKFDIEADWSAASYWYEIAALSATEVKLFGLQHKSFQGDSLIAKIFEAFGITTSFQDSYVLLKPSPELTPRLNIDLSEQPDLAQTIAVTSCLLGIPFHLTGLSTLRIKETDRLEALKNELAKFGYLLSIERNSELIWSGDHIPVFEMPSINTYEDHRMAMAFAPSALFVPGIKINNIEVVSKSYPQFWSHLQDAGFILTEAEQTKE